MIVIHWNILVEFGMHHWWVCQNSGLNSPEVYNALDIEKTVTLILLKLYSFLE